MTQKLKTLTKIFLSCLVFILSSCEKENIDVNNQEASVIEAKNWLENSSPELNILKYTKQIDWNNAIVTDGAKGKVVEVPIVLKDNLVVKGDDKTLSTYNRLMFIADEKETYKLSHVLITTKESTFSTSDKTFNFYTIKENFEGVVTVLNAKNKIVFNSFSQKNPHSISGKLKNAPMICYGLYEVFDDGSSRFTGIISHCDGEGGGDSGGSGGGGYGGDGTAPTETTTEIIERNIDDTKLDPCPKAVFEQLKNATNCDIANLLEKLGAKEGINVTMKSETPANGDTGQTTRTNPGVRYDYTIKITKDNANATQLFKANAILHELVHAYFMSLKDDYDTSGNPAVYIEFPILFQTYVDKTYTGSDGPDHHTEMAKVYVNAIGSALQEFQTGVAMPYGTIPEQIYTDMACME